jgi:hypothetical protein
MRKHATLQRLTGIGSALLLLALAAGCSDDKGGSGTGTLSLQLTDAPYPYDMIAEAVVTIDRVEVRMDADDPEKTAMYLLDDKVRTLDLLTLQNGATEMMAFKEVPVGRVGQIRLHVVDAHVTLTDGRTFDLQIPSGSSSGLKIFPEPDILVVGDLTTELLLDFDVAESFKSIPASPNRVEDIDHFQFRPTLHVANLSETGTISGYVLDDGGSELDLSDDTAIADATVQVEAAGTLRSTSTDSEGFYRIMGLRPGEWTVTISADGHEPRVETVVVVVANDVVVETARLEDDPDLDGTGEPTEGVLASD